MSYLYLLPLPLSPADVEQRVAAASDGQLAVAPLVTGLEVRRAQRQGNRAVRLAWQRVERLVEREWQRRTAERQARQETS